MRHALIWSTTCLLLLAPWARADGDADASERGVKLLAGMNAADAQYASKQLLGIYMNDTLVGYLTTTLSPCGGDKPGYDFELKAEMKVGDVLQMRRVLAGQLGANFAPIQADGEEHGSKGGKPVNDTYGFATTPDSGLVWTAQSGENAQQSHKVEGPVQSIRGCDLLLTKVWVGLPEGQPHRFMALNCEKGVVEEIELTRGPTSRRPVDGTEREVIVITTRRTTEDPKASDAILCDAATGQILEAKPGNAPVAMRPITPEQLAAWQAGGPAAPPAAGGAPVDVVVKFFVAMANQDKAALLSTIEPQAFCTSAAVGAVDAANRDKVLAEIEAKFAANAEAAADEFVTSILASVAKSNLPKEPMAYQAMMRQKSATDVQAEVEFAPGGVAAISYQLVKIEGAWKIVEQKKLR